MGIEGVIARLCKQKCVYWGTPVNDGYGGKTFADPVEIDCRWEETIQVVTDARGVEVTSRAMIYSVQDLDYEGMLFLGTLDELYDSAESSAGAIDDPMQIEGAYVIKRFEKTPVLGSSTEFLRKAYLTPSLSFGGF